MKNKITENQSIIEELYDFGEYFQTILWLGFYIEDNDIETNGKPISSHNAELDSKVLSYLLNVYNYFSGKTKENHKNTLSEDGTFYQFNSQIAVRCFCTTHTINKSIQRLKLNNWFSYYTTQDIRDGKIKSINHYSLNFEKIKQVRDLYSSTEARNQRIAKAYEKVKSD